MRYSLGGETIIGRDPDVSVSIDDSGISRHHARITQHEDGDFLLEDMGSHNGTSVNGLSITEHQLTFGDKVTVGHQTVLIFTYTDPHEQRLLQSQKFEAVGRLAAGVSHEFNNLLAVVTINLSILECDEGLSDEERLLCIAEAKSAANRGAELTRRMLDFSRASHSEMRPVDLSKLMTEVTQLAQRTFGPQIKVVEELEEALSTRGDRLQLYQVMMNLCLNARDAMPDGGTLTVQTRRCCALPTGDCSLPRELPPGAYLEVVIADTGRGMDATTLDRAFDPFFTTKEVGEGTGLGLSMVQGLIRNHEGAVRLQSEVDVGTQITIYLPSADPSQERETGTADLPSIVPQEGIRVLLVEDDDLVRRAMVRSLRRSGYVCIEAVNGRDGVEKYQHAADEIDVVLLDVLMPEMDGEEAFDRLKAINDKVKVIITTGCADGLLKERLLTAGVSAFLAKPVAVKELRAAIAQVLRPGAG
ncbi:MAG: response regulator [Deltaproteobacteria bacterium]|nr:response regulator [Deltaproteobacteria bacterium]